jgi:hypothetical protein
MGSIPAMIKKDTCIYYHILRKVVICLSNVSIHNFKIPQGPPEQCHPSFAVFETPRLTHHWAKCRPHIVGLHDMSGDFAAPVGCLSQAVFSTGQFCFWRVSLLLFLRLSRLRQIWMMLVSSRIPGWWKGIERLLWQRLWLVITIPY